MTYRMLLVGVMLAAAESAWAASEAAIDFYRAEVLPVLEEHCYECHGGARVKSGFRMTSKAEFVGGGNRGPAFDAEAPESSVFLEMISYKDDEHQMPPEAPLPAEDADILREWVAMGLPWDPATLEPQQAPEVTSDHWAYQPLTRPEVPTPSDGAWNANPIDAFIRAGLDEAGLSPAAPASKQSYIRRAYFDLIGLSPSPEEVRAFVNDDSPNAHAKLIDYLLASPHYGEKWGRHWLDLVRYADSNGYERDSNKPYMWRYRDYVIESFNEDKPYDQFLKEQLAGDELDEVTPESIVATGYYRLGLWDDEPADPLLARYDGLDDIVNTTGQVMLAMTMGCARCHDHKIDPISQADYYRFTSFVENITDMSLNGITRSILTPFEEEVREQRLRDKQARIDALHGRVYAFENDARAKFAIAGAVEQSSLPTSDMSDLNYRFYRNTWDALPEFDGLRPETTGKVAHNYFTLATASRRDAIGLVFEGRIRAPETGAYTFHMDVKDGVRLTVDGEVVYEIPRQGRSYGDVTVDMEEGYAPIRLDFFNATEEPILNISWSGPGFKRRPLTTDDDEALAKQFEKLLDEHGEAVLGREAVQRYETLKDDLREARRENIPGEWATCVEERGPDAPPSHVLLRGNPHVQGIEVEPGFPSVLNPPEPRIRQPESNPESTGRRRALAEWIASEDNPLTARVMMNRLWQHHFGRGIVRSTNDFGMAGDKPTHPELLDWLATEFMARDWSIKDMHRLMMLSKTYRMSSAGDEDALAKDPENHHFWRFNMRRLMAEEIRDAILDVSGQINLSMGGPGVYPPLPEAVLETSSKPQDMWFLSPEEQWGRRSIYIHVKRSLLDPLLKDFDLADTDSSCPVRFATMQPTQALSLLNSKLVNDAAKAFADRVRDDTGPSMRDRVRDAFALATSRAPKESEIEQGMAFIEEMTTEFEMAPEEAFERFCLLALNLNEFVFLD